MTVVTHADALNNDLIFMCARNPVSKGAAEKTKTPTPPGGKLMGRRTILLLLCAAAVALVFTATTAQAQHAYNRQWGSAYTSQDCNRFYHYPYIYYPQNFWGNDYYRSRDNLYYRYPAEMRIPVYNRQWHNYYPEGRRWHSGAHFNLDVF
jgi:hypothetical protein